MTRPDQKGELRPPREARNIGRFVGADYLAPDGTWTLGEFRIIEPVPTPTVKEVLKHAVATEAEAMTQWTEFPCGAALRLNANGNGYEPMTFLHRGKGGEFQLIRRKQSRCTVCGGGRVMFVYPDGSATCGVCELGRD